MLLKRTENSVTYTISKSTRHYQAYFNAIYSFFSTSCSSSILLLFWIVIWWVKQLQNYQNCYYYHTLINNWTCLIVSVIGISHECHDDTKAQLNCISKTYTKSIKNRTKVVSITSTPGGFLICSSLFCPSTAFGFDFRLSTSAFDGYLRVAVLLHSRHLRLVLTSATKSLVTCLTFMMAADT